MIQIFSCKKCNKDFEIDDVHYWNYKCPDCETMSLPKNYTLPRFKGLPTVKS
jgi:phage FluMu protein Com